MITFQFEEFSTILLDLFGIENLSPVLICVSKKCVVTWFHVPIFGFFKMSNNLMN